MGTACSCTRNKSRRTEGTKYVREVRVQSIYISFSKEKQSRFGFLFSRFRIRNKVDSIITDFDIGRVTTEHTITVQSPLTRVILPTGTRDRTESLLIRVSTEKTGVPVDFPTVEIGVAGGGTTKTRVASRRRKGRSPPGLERT